MTARTPTSAPGNRPHRQSGGWRPATAGFTLIELLMVLLLIAMMSGLASLALRDGSEARLDREAARLGALLEAGRAEARASGLAVRFELASADTRGIGGDGEVDFRFVGLPQGSLQGGGPAPQRWLDHDVVARIEGARALRLGPEPLIGAQRIVLSLGQQQRVLATDGLSPFAVEDPAGTQP